MARKRSACYLSIALITFMSGSRTFLNFGAKMPPDRRPVRQARSAALHNGLRALGWENGHNVRIEWRWASLLHWCRPSGPVKPLADGHLRATVDGWHSTSLGGTPLTIDRLSGHLLKVQMFRGT